MAFRHYDKPAGGVAMVRDYQVPHSAVKHAALAFVTCGFSLVWTASLLFDRKHYFKIWA